MSNLSVGIVGLPNVGKSTLFNALLRRQQALAANYPFATIEPNVGIVEVPDERLIALAKTVVKETNRVEEVKDEDLPPLKFANIEFLDIAGLVEGASKGEGLGNQFLANIREVDLICHVLRAFNDENVVITGKMNPLEDLLTVRMELIFKDLETIKKSLDSKIKNLDEKKLKEQVFGKIIETLDKGKMANTIDLSPEELELVQSLHLLTMKPEIFVLNVGEELLNSDQAALCAKYAQQLNVEPKTVVTISAKIESELSTLSAEDQELFLTDLGLDSSGIERMAKVAYEKLGLISFLTAGMIECKAWTIRKGIDAQAAAGVIHTDFSKKFIKANVIDWQEFVSLGGWKKAKEVGKIRQEGRDYIVADGDVIEFMIGR